MKVKVICNRPQKSLNNYHAKTVKVKILNNYLAHVGHLTKLQDQFNKISVGYFSRKPQSGKN